MLQAQVIKWRVSVKEVPIPMCCFATFSGRVSSTVLAVLALSILAGVSPALASMPSAQFGNLDKRAFALGEINGYLSMCGAASALRHRAIVTSEAKRAGASDRQLEALIYAFNKGLSAGATAAPMQFSGCGREFYSFLAQKNEALGALQKQSGHLLHNK
jgi:branched-subunit amino acid permease